MTVSYSFKQTSNSAFFFVLQNVSESKKCQWLSAADEQSIYVKACVRVTLQWFCVHTNLAASIHVEQTDTTSQLLGVLDAMPQYAGGEIEGALIRLSTQGEIHKHIYLPAMQQTCHYFYLYIRSSETNSAYSEHDYEPSTFLLLSVKTKALICLLLKKTRRVIFLNSSLRIKSIPPNLTEQTAG